MFHVSARPADHAGPDDVPAPDGIDVPRWVCAAPRRGADIRSDAVSGVKETLLPDLRRVEDPARAQDLGFDGPLREVEHDLVLARPGQAPA